MKIVYFRLKGYIKVLNGMGLDEIVIPFDQFKNRIILVQGENGCAKSTIIAALSPNPDTSDSFRTDVIVDTFGNRQIIEYPAEKEIHYVSQNEQGNFDYIKILIQSIVDESRTRRTTKAFISKNEEELNPNGNVSTFKEIRDSVLGIDPIYLDLSSVSSENRGIVDMIPSERRKYMASYIGSLETYNNIFKVISKKVTTLKSYINTLNTKLYELGDESELRLQMSQLQTTLKDLNKQRDNLLKKLAEAEATVQIIDPDNKMQDLYASISERLVTINSEMKQIQEEIDKVHSSLKLSGENIDILKLLEDTKSLLDGYEKSVSDSKAKITTLMSLNEAILSSIESDTAILNGLSIESVQDNIESAVENLRSEVEMYESYLTKDDIKTLKSTSIDELTDLRDSLQKFSDAIVSAEELCSSEEFGLAVNLALEADIKAETKSSIDYWRNKISDQEKEIILLNAEAEKIQSELDQLRDFDNSRPKKCNIDTCPYISRFVELKKSCKTEEDIERINARVRALEINNSKLSEKIKSLILSQDVSSYIEVALSYILTKKTTISKIKGLSHLPTTVKAQIINHHRFKPEFEAISSMIEKAYIFIELDKAKDQLNSLEGDLKIYLNNKSLIESLTTSIEKNHKDYESREEEIKNLTRECNFNTGLASEYRLRVEIINRLIELDTRLSGVISEKEHLKQEFESVKDKIRLVKEKVDSVNDIKNDIQKIEDTLAPLNDAISKLGYDLSSIVEYQHEFKESSDKYDKMLFIRNACSPGNGLGIQSEYIKRYMNDIIIDCNKMLGYMFGGVIQLDVPVINEKQFSIPFLGPNGIIVPDISNGSTAQKCMIGLVFSCVAMMKSSTKYNIPRFDEIDGGLDQGNRITFINVLNQILDFMRSEQCIICSHNMEFDTQSTTRLLCSHNGIRIEQ